MNNNDRELERLMNDQLDGIATSEESERLSRALESRDEVRLEYRKLGGVFAALSRLEMEEPPESLKRDILGSIRASEAGSPSRQGWVRSIAALLGGSATLRYAYSFAAGAALAVLALAVLSGNLLTRQGIDSRPFAGTMAPLSSGGNYRHISQRDFVLRDGRVLAETLSDGDRLMVRISADTPPGTDLAVEFDPADWSPAAVRQQSAGNEVMLGMGRLSVRMLRSGQSQYLLYLARRGPAGSPFRISIHSPDGYVHGELETRALRSGS